MNYFSKSHLQPWGLELVNKYPLIFLEDDEEIVSLNENSSDRVNLRYGFEHGEGWKGLVNELANTATEIVEHLRSEEPPYTKAPFIHGFICKEKFGGFCWQGKYKLPELFNKLWNTYVSDIEYKSHQTCELTGTYGVRCKKNDGGWIRTLSMEKAKEIGYSPLAI
jgi:hypothetical protein